MAKVTCSPMILLVRSFFLLFLFLIYSLTNNVTCDLRLPSTSNKFDDIDEMPQMSASNGQFLVPAIYASNLGSEGSSSNSSIALFDYGSFSGFDDIGIIGASGEQEQLPISSRSLTRRQVLALGDPMNSDLSDYDAYSAMSALSKSNLPLGTDSSLPVSSSGSFMGSVPGTFLSGLISRNGLGSDDEPSLNSIGQQQQQQQQVSSSMGNQANIQANQKTGPTFLKEPPSFIYYLNSSDLVIPCVASGNPEPTIVSIKWFYACC